MGETHIRWLAGVLALLAVGAGLAPARAQSGGGEAPAPGRRMYGRGHPFTIDELPAGTFRERLQSLSGPARGRALAWLHRFAFPAADAAYLRVDNEGGIFYADPAPEGPAPEEETEPVGPPAADAAAAMPVSPFPEALKFHSRPGATRSIYLDFDGETVTGTAWNTYLGRDPIPARPFSTDADITTFSAAEQTIITRVWQRVAEDYSPFDVDVTTAFPSTEPRRTAHVLITRSTDAAGQPNPYSSGGGVSYVDVFGTFTFPHYSPAWVYANNLNNTEASMAESASHEVGHNLGLSHDGKTGGAEYYSGHGNNDISWAPIMGTAYYKNVTQWNRGEYYLANNLEDDLEIITRYLPYRGDDHGNTASEATPLEVAGGTNIVSTTPETDPGNAAAANKGILERTGDVDVFRFTSAAGTLSLRVDSWVSPVGTRGGNVDLLARLYNESGRLLAEANPPDRTHAELTATVAAGEYFLEVRATGAGTPLVSPATGYTDFGCVGQYFISGALPSPPTWELAVSANRPEWGSVLPPGGAYPDQAVVELAALPNDYFRFVEWQGAVSSTNNPQAITLVTNQAVEAVFAEILTAAFPTPWWWLAGYGYTNDFETASQQTGLNGLPVWASYVAGLDPNDPASTLRISLAPSSAGPNALTWSAVSGRVYSIYFSTNLLEGFAPLPGASQLPWTSAAAAAPAEDLPSPAFYRLDVQLAP